MYLPNQRIFKTSVIFQANFLQNFFINKNERRRIKKVLSERSCKASIKRYLPKFCWWKKNFITKYEKCNWLVEVKESPCNDIEDYFHSNNSSDKGISETDFTNISETLKGKSVEDLLYIELFAVTHAHSEKKF
jgi:hypothetical protein